MVGKFQCTFSNYTCSINYVVAFDIKLGNLLVVYDNHHAIFHSIMILLTALSLLDFFASSMFE